MDLSKLPKLSETPAPPPAEPKPASVARTAPPTEPSGPEAWISIAIGGILLFAFPNTWHWLLNYYPPVITDTSTGNPVSYAQSIFFFGDLCVFAFALVLIADGLILFTRKRA